MSGINGLDQEKLETITDLTLERRSNNVAPSQKTAWPRWARRGREKSTIALACAWVVEHQISKEYRGKYQNEPKTNTRPQAYR